MLSAAGAVVHALQFGIALEVVIKWLYAVSYMHTRS